ncbi:hypothetical protein KIPB_000507, partial [Kipferlia bialata]|eukprot:g507.t1
MVATAVWVLVSLLTASAASHAYQAYRYVQRRRGERHSDIVPMSSLIDDRGEDEMVQLSDSECPNLTLPSPPAILPPLPRISIPNAPSPKAGVWRRGDDKGRGGERESTWGMQSLRGVDTGCQTNIDAEAELETVGKRDTPEEERVSTPPLPTVETASTGIQCSRERKRHMVNRGSSKTPLSTAATGTFTDQSYSVESSTQASMPLPRPPTPAPRVETASIGVQSVYIPIPTPPREVAVPEEAPVVHKEDGKSETVCVDACTNTEPEADVIPPSLVSVGVSARVPTTHTSSDAICTTPPLVHKGSDPHLLSSVHRSVQHVERETEREDACTQVPIEEVVHIGVQVAKTNRSMGTDPVVCGLDLSLSPAEGVCEIPPTVTLAVHTQTSKVPTDTTPCQTDEVETEAVETAPTHPLGALQEMPPVLRAIASLSLPPSVSTGIEGLADSLVADVAQVSGSDGQSSALVHALLDTATGDRQAETETEGEREREVDFGYDIDHVSHGVTRRVRTREGRRRMQIGKGREAASPSAAKGSLGRSMAVPPVKHPLREEHGERERETDLSLGDAAAVSLSSLLKATPSLSPSLGLLAKGIAESPAHRCDAYLHGIRYYDSSLASHTLSHADMVQGRLTLTDAVALLSTLPGPYAPNLSAL